eukprot:195248-Pelagomonas_calceolata.AAC.2
MHATYLRSMPKAFRVTHWDSGHTWDQWQGHSEPWQCSPVRRMWIHPESWMQTTAFGSGVW